MNYNEKILQIQLYQKINGMDFSKLNHLVKIINYKINKEHQNLEFLRNYGVNLHLNLNEREHHFNALNNGFYKYQVLHNINECHSKIGQLEIEQNIIKNKMNKMIKKQKVLNAKMKSLSLQNKKRLKSAESNNQVNFFICNYFFE